MIPDGYRLATREELDARLRPYPITKPDGYNTRTGYPERGGIFCCRTFGPLDDDRCLCGKYDGEKYRGITCEKCGVDVTSKSVRGERFGRIELAVPIVHAWFAEKYDPEEPGPPPDLPMLTLLPVLPPDARPIFNNLLGGTNRRYMRVVEQNERYKEFRDRCAPDIVLLAEQAELFKAVASLLGNNRWSGDSRRKPASIAGRMAVEEDVDRELLAAAIVRE